jgi:bacterioferritin
MNREHVVAELNNILSLEYTAVVQYTHESFLLDGIERPSYLQMFKAEAAESLAHAQMIGEKIVALGGVPTTELGEIAVAADLRDMLVNNLRLERAAVEAYSRALLLCEDDVPLRTMLENQIATEQASVEELERILKGVQVDRVEARSSEVPAPARSRRAPRPRAV